MKNTTLKLLLIALSLSLVQMLSAQIFITGITDSIASLNKAFTANVEFVDVPGGDPTDFELLTAPVGMSINSSGVISWTPTAIDQGGMATVRGWDSNGEDTKSFYFYITDEIICDPDLVSYWNMNNIISNSATDDAGGYDAVIDGNTDPTVSTDGVVGNSFRFVPDDRLDAFMTAPEDDQYDAQDDDDFSISLWFKRIPTLVSPAQPIETILAKSSATTPYPNGGRWQIFYADDSYVHFSIQDNSTNGFSFKKIKTITDTNWHHVVVTADLRGTPDTLESQFQIYVDNQVTAPSDSGFYDFISNGNTIIGNRGLSFGSFDDSEANKTPFSGNLDEVAYYNKRLSSAEVLALFNKGQAGEPVCQAGNIAPIVLSAPIESIDEDSPYSYDINYREIDGDPVTMTATVKPSWLDFNSSTGVLSGTPLNDNVGDTTVTVEISDGTAIIEHTFALAVNNTNDAPTITSTAVTAVDEDVLYTYTFEAEDVDAGDAITLSAPVLPAWLDFNTSTGVLSNIPTNDQVLLEATVDYDVTLRASDNFGGVIDEVFVITVTNINDTLEITGQNAVTTDEDTDKIIDLTALNVTDVDNTYPDDFTLTVKAGTNYTFNANTITPDENWSGTLTVPVDISDGGITVSTDLSVTVTAVNDKPKFTSVPVESALANAQYQYWIVAEDVEGSALTITAAEDLPDWLNFSANAGSGLLQGTPTLENVGIDTVTLEVTDGTATTVQSFELEVVADNWPPEITSGPAGTDAPLNEVYSYVVTATDKDEDPLTYSATVPSWMSFDAGTQLLSGIPGAGDVGAHSVVITVSDGIASDEEQITIVVGPNAIGTSSIEFARVYPVPANNFVVFEFGTTLNNISVQIYSLAGSLLIDERFDSQSEVNLNITELKSGQYLYIITNDEGYQKGTLLKK